MITTKQRTTDVAGVVFGYVLHALCARQTYDYVSSSGLPPATIHVDDRGAVLSVTRTAAPTLRDAVKRYARELQYDVILFRVTGQDRDFVELAVDLTLGLLPCGLWSMTDLALWTGRAGDTWLVPEGFGPAVSLSQDGVILELIPPYDTLAQRSSGILRAAADIASLLPVAAR